MRILGVDPGTRVCGYGVIEASSQRSYRYIECGVIEPPKSSSMESRLGDIARWLTEIVTELRPAVIAVEDCFSHKNVRSTMAIAQARGTVMAVAGLAGLPVFSYAPRFVKRSVTGRGAATKEQVARMIQALLDLKTLPSSDAADALAMAMAHAQLADYKRDTMQELETQL